ncbi:PQQ-binding-like beta-propeller repeat protein [Streptomyces sp. NPDC046465]|uniref:outer membrane protein assembly factor BamB family protein n=1 Tax=Streptomyces sp. NPDC046465 TaxID=3155810 RepID=UPI0033F71921
MSFGPPPSRFTQSVVAAAEGRKRRTSLVVGVLLALVAALCSGAWALWGSGGEASDAAPASARPSPDAIRETVERTPGTPEGGTVAEYTLKTLKEGEEAPAPGLWATDKIVAKGTANVIRGISVKDAEEEWKIKFRGPLCAVTRHVSVDGRTAVIYSGQGPAKADKKGGTGRDSAAAPCDRVAVFDVDTGRKLWDKKLPGESAAAMSVNITMTQGTVLTATGQVSVGYDMTTGKRLWSDTRPSDCVDVGFAGGRGLLALVQCGDSTDPEFRIQRIAPRSGKSLWTYKVAPGIQGVRIASSKPPVIAVAAGDIQVTTLIALTDRGKQRSTIRLEDDRYVHGCDGTFSSQVELCTGVVVGDRQLYMATKPRDFSPETSRGLPSNEVVAFDLSTGNGVRKFAAKPGRPMFPLRMSGDKVIAYREAANAPSAAVSLDPKSGKEALLLLFGNPEMSEMTALDPPDVVYERGRIFLAATRVERPKGDGPHQLVMRGFESSG